MLTRVVMGTVDGDPPAVAASQLAKLGLVNRAFRDTATQVQQKQPAVQRATSEQQLAHAIKEAIGEWARVQTDRLNHPAKEDGRFDTLEESITARLGAVVRGLDPVIVDLSHFGNRDRLAQVFQDALSRHQNLRALEVVAQEGWQLNQMTQLLDTRPELLRSLDVAMETNYKLVDANSGKSAGLLAKVLAKQTNLTALKLQDRHEATFGRARSPLVYNHMDKAVASLPGLKSLALSGYHFLQQDGKNDGTTLAEVLRKLPALEALELSNSVFKAAAFAEFASSWRTLPGLRFLDLGQTDLRGELDVDGESIGHLARMLPALEKLETLNLSSTGLRSADIDHLASGLTGLKHLQTLNLTGNSLGPEGRSRLIAVAADVPTLQHLHLSRPLRRETPDLATLESALSPLAERRELHVHLTGMDEESVSQLQAALPNLRISND